MARYHNPSYKYEAIVIKVIDGDTLRLSIDMGFHNRTIQTIRLLGIDTPELRPRKAKYTKDGIFDEEAHKGEKLKAQEATDFVISQCPPGKKVFVYTTKGDSFGRWLGTIYVQVDDPVSLNDILVQKGHAVEYRR